MLLLKNIVVLLNFINTRFAESLSLNNLSDHKSWEILKKMPCGETSSDRIIGGSYSSMGQFPWIARLGYRVEGEPVVEWLCGGTLITDRHVLTAAHCLTAEDMPEYQLLWVRLGEYDTRTNPDCQLNVCAPLVQDIRIKSIIKHKDFNVPVFNNDIAILELEHPAKIDEFVMPICISRPEQNIEWKVGDFATVAGWGKTNVTTEERAYILKFVQIPILEDNACNLLTKNFKMSEGQICAGAQVNEDACGGDSGGPLMKVYATDEGPKTFIIGVVSFGPAHCGINKPGVYSSVPYFLKWILDSIQTH